MSFQNIKILPLLVFVAMLAFSVRLVDVVTGVATLSGAAHAEEHKAEEKKEEKKGHGEGPESLGSETIPLPPPIEGSMDADKKGSLQFPDKDAAAKDASKTKPIGWQDATEMDLGSSDVRKELGDDLAKRRADLDRREKELQTKEALLKAGQQELDQKFNELTQLRGEIEKLLQTQSEQEQSRITSLVKIYEGMKPGDAARIFNTLDLDVLMAVMSKMSERKLSPILGLMESERAKTITIMLAQQKQLPALPPSQ